jgi:hypothetical protein
MRATKLAHQWRVMRQWSGRDRLLLFITFVLLTGIRLGLWLLPFQTLLRRLQQLSRLAFRETNRETNRETEQSAISISSIIWAVNVISRYLAPNSKCLARALATQMLLEWQGHEGQFRIGVAKAESGQLEAHAWVEIGDRVAMGNLPDLSRYQPLPNLNILID